VPPGSIGLYNAVGNYPDLTNLQGDWEVASIKGEKTFRWREAKVGDKLRIIDVSLVAGSPQNPASDYYVISPLKTPKEFDVTFWVSNLFLTQPGIYTNWLETNSSCAWHPTRVRDQLSLLRRMRKAHFWSSNGFPHLKTERICLTLRVSINKALFLASHKQQYPV
jgi:hypothetical protein